MVRLKLYCSKLIASLRLTRKIDNYSDINDETQKPQELKKPEYHYSGFLLNG